MKNALQLLLFLLFCYSLQAQKNVEIKINHFLNGEQFELNADAQNNLENDFLLDRLEYYLSSFSVVHDGGEVTFIEASYELISMVNNEGPVEPTTIDLGEFDIQELEGVKFHFGVDKEANHADPSLWPEDHPLAPRFPSMHWGWAAGYRFIALEGMSGPAIDQELQFHCIGNEFYTELSFPVSMTEGDTYTVEIDAEYANLLSDIDISSGKILHGNLDDIKTLASNMTTKVFTMAEISSVDAASVESFEVFPNPSATGQLNFKLEGDPQKYSVSIYDAFGKEVVRGLSTNKSIYIPQSGLYYVTLAKADGKAVTSQRVVIQ